MTHRIKENKTTSIKKKSFTHLLSKIEILEAKKEAAVPVSPEQRLVSDGTTVDVVWDLQLQLYLN